MTACNYDEFATADDGSCSYEALTIEINPDNYASEISWDLVDSLGMVIASGASAGTELCLNAECFTFTMYDSFGDGICCSYGQGSYSVYDGNGTVVASGGEYGSSESTSFCLPAVPGCTDELACNYTPGSNIDDGSCDYSCIGCMDQAAANYDPTATQENEGSCVYCESGTYVMNVEMTDAGGDGWNGSNYYLDAYDGSISLSGNYDEADTYIDGVGIDFHCIPLGCYLFSHGGGSADAENSVTITDQFGTTYADALASGASGWTSTLVCSETVVSKDVQILSASTTTFLLQWTMDLASALHQTTQSKMLKPSVVTWKCLALWRTLLTKKV